jgi:hypothetical protein
MKACNTRGRALKRAKHQRTPVAPRARKPRPKTIVGKAPHPDGDAVLDAVAVAELDARHRVAEAYLA